MLGIRKSPISYLVRSICILLHLNEKYEKMIMKYLSEYKKYGQISVIVSIVENKQCPLVQYTQLLSIKADKLIIDDYEPEIEDVKEEIIRSLCFGSVVHSDNDFEVRHYESGDIHKLIFIIRGNCRYCKYVSVLIFNISR